MILSQRQLEEIAASTTKDFNRFFFGDEADKPDRSALPTPIDQFAKNYLGLRVSFARLSPDGSICGVTAYADTEYKITELGITRTLALKRNQVILTRVSFSPATCSGSAPSVDLPLPTSAPIRFSSNWNRKR